jgi:sarcosine oxidase subunit gamma
MAELPRAHPLEAWATTWEDLPGTVAITVEPYVAMADVRTADGPQLTAALGVALPAAPNTWRSAGAGRAIWLGPDEWLLTSPTERPEQLVNRIRAGMLPFGGAVVDVSAQRITLRLHGARARDVLTKGCSIDLHPRSFGGGSSAQTTLGQADVILLALSDRGDDYAVLVRSSFAGYLADWLEDAALEFTAGEFTAGEFTAGEFTTITTGSQE